MAFGHQDRHSAERSIGLQSCFFVTTSIKRRIPYNRSVSSIDQALLADIFGDTLSTSATSDKPNRTLGRLCGWDTRLGDVSKRMRCSKCGKTNWAFPPRKPRGYSSLPV
jgi:hypothetical protein